MDRVPRYTSYPTAPNFHEGIDAEHYAKWLNELQEDTSLSLYFHIPFCRQLCWFCGCHTKIVNHYDPIARYMALLEKEVQLVTAHLKGGAVEHIHFGGGSPTVISPEGFLKFNKVVRGSFNIKSSAEIAIEMDPRSVDKDKIAAYKAAGITRASIGVQDFDEHVQRAINRVQPFELVRDVVQNLRKAEIISLNIDLVYGLPHQTTATLKQTINQTLDLSPDRISLFGYAHVPWLKKHQNLVPIKALPCEDARIEMFEAATDQLNKAGYSAVGLDHFVKSDDHLATALEKGCLNRNFQGYTTDKAEALLGFGVSAITTLPSSYLQNTSDNRNYTQAIQDNVLPIARGIELDLVDIERRNIIMSLMCSMKARVCQNKYTEELNRLASFMERKQVSYRQGMLTVSPAARKYIRLIASVFDTYLDNADQRFSQAV